MLDDKSIMRAYKAFVRSKIEYGSLAYWGAAESHLKKLDIEFKRVLWSYSATLTLLYYPLHWKIEENQLLLDSPVSYQ